MGIYTVAQASKMDCVPKFKPGAVTPKCIPLENGEVICPFWEWAQNQGKKTGPWGYCGATFGDKANR
jgi:hypothetical protein